MRVRPVLPAVALAGVLATAACAARPETEPGPAHAGGTPSSAETRPPGQVDLASAVRQWWRRVASIPASRYFDARLCGLDQPGAIWLLGGGAPQGAAERHCAVPANRPILAPVVNEVWSPADTSPPGPALSPGRMEVRLDGRPLTPVRVTNDRPYAIVSAAPRNPVGFRAGTRIADDGYWVLVDPGLPPGRHRLEIRGSGMPARLWTLVAS